MKSVKTKVICLVLGCMLLSSLVIGSVSIINSKLVVTDDSAQMMNLLCENQAQQIDATLIRIEQSVKTLAIYALSQLDDIQQFQENPEYVAQYSNLLSPVAINSAQNTEGALTVYIRFNPDYTSSTAGLFCSRATQDSNFEILPPTDLLAYAPEDVAHVGWFYLPAQKKQPMWIAPYLNKNINVEMISYVIPLYVGNVFVGVVGMDIDYSVLTSIVSDTHVYQTGYAFLADSGANILYHHELPMGTSLLTYNNGEFSVMAQDLRMDSSGQDLYSYRYSGTDKKIAFRRLCNDMRFVLTAPKAEIELEANNLILQILAAALIIIFISALLALFFARRLVKPLLELNIAAQKIAGGDLSISITHQSKDEVGALADSFRETANHLQRYIKYINELAYRDPLTGVKNKTAYLELVEELEQKSHYHRPQYAVVVFDINGLKHVNDTLGHDFGDMMIMEACKMICRSFRKSPVFRIGGDEFIAILESTDFDHYSSLLDDFQKEMDTFNQRPNRDFSIAIARGIALYNEFSDLSYNDVFKRADSAMYRNKQEMKQKESPVGQ